MKVLITYEAIPEQTYMAIVELDFLDYESLSKAHGCVVNKMDLSQDQQEAVDAIGWGFSTNKDHEKYLTTDLDSKWFMKFNDIYMSDELIDLSGVEKMINCAFIM